MSGDTHPILTFNNSGGGGACPSPLALVATLKWVANTVQMLCGIDSLY